MLMHIKTQGIEVGRKAFMQPISFINHHEEHGENEGKTRAVTCETWSLMESLRKSLL